MNIESILEKHNQWLAGEAGGERANLQGADLRGANLWGANLQDANLRGANLRGAILLDANLQDANLRGASLWDCVGDMRYIKTIACDTYTITYTSEVIQIGCQRHPINDWWGFSDEQISVMDNGALEWWKRWKPIIQQIIEISPA